MKTKRAVWTLCLLLLSACAATVKQPDNAGRPIIQVPTESAQHLILSMTSTQSNVGDDWESFRGEWRTAFRAQARQAGMAFDVQEGPQKPTGERGTLLDVRIDDYRYLTPGARYGFGIMTGNAYIVARIRFLNLANGELFGEQRYSTTSTAWEGVFSAMTGKQVEGIAAQVVRSIITKSDQRGAPTLAAFEKLLRHKISGLRASHRTTRRQQRLIAQKKGAQDWRKLVNLSNGVAQGSTNEMLASSPRPNSCAGKNAPMLFRPLPRPTPP